MSYSTTLYFSDSKAHRRIENALSIKFNNLAIYENDKYKLIINHDSILVEFHEYCATFMLSILNAINDALLLDIKSYEITDENTNEIISIMNEEDEKISIIPENHIHDMMLKIFNFKFSFKSVTADTYDRNNSALITFHDCDVLKTETDDIRVGKCDYIKFHMKLNVFWASNSMFKPIL